MRRSFVNSTSWTAANPESTTCRNAPEDTPLETLAYVGGGLPVAH